MIMTDEQDGRRMGCMDWPKVHTPNLDALAENGVLFENCYCDSPLCVPSRGAFATGRRVSEIHCWDNASPFDDSWPTWGHRLEEQGVQVQTFGKLDFVEPCGDHGFKRVFQEVRRPFGDVYGLYRDPVRQRRNAAQRLDKAGPRERATSRDDAVQEKVLDWLRSDVPRSGDPWILYVGFVSPHFPHVAPPEFYNLYDPDDVELPHVTQDDLDALNPLNKDLRYHFEVERLPDRDKWVRNVIGYHALISYVDHQLGQLLQTLDDEGLADDTLVIFGSDHGELLGAHGMWWKCAPYEPSVRVPLIMAGPGVDAGRRISNPVQSIDLFPTFVEATGCQLTAADADLPGESLFPAVMGEEFGHRDYAFSQYHGHGVRNGWFALRRGEYKYIHYHDHGCELYNLSDDPEEFEDLSAQPDQQYRIAEFDELLHSLVDPGKVDADSKADQAARLEWIRENMPEEEFQKATGGG
jgi:choline-sulfatase